MEYIIEVYIILIQMEERYLSWDLPIFRDHCFYIYYLISIYFDL